MKNQELLGSEGELRVGLAVVVGELDLVGPVEQLHDRPDLTSREAVARKVRKERDDIEQAGCGMHFCRLYFRKQLVKRGAVSPRRTIHVLLTVPEPREPLTSNSTT